jgi:hypothetical protein
MTQTASVWLVIGLVLVAANIPFITQRFLGVWTLAIEKSLALRLLELLIFYFAAGLMAWALEKNMGQNAPQGWEFYAITASVFLTFAFPGFVYRYLYRKS